MMGKPKGEDFRLDSRAEETLSHFVSRLRELLIDEASKAAGRRPIESNDLEEAYIVVTSRHLDKSILDAQAIISQTLRENRAFEWVSYAMALSLFLLGIILVGVGIFSGKGAAYSVTSIVGGALFELLILVPFRVAVHRCSSSCFAEAFAREYGHQWTTIGVSGYGSWLVSTSRSLIRCTRRGCRRHRRTHFRTSRSLQTLHPSTPPALRSLRLPATVMAARCQRTTPQLPPPSTQTPIALAVCKSRSLSRSVRTSGFPFHSLYPA